MTWWMWDIQDNTGYWSYLREPTGGQDYRKMSSNIYRNALNTNKIKFNTKGR